MQINSQPQRKRRETRDFLSGCNGSAHVTNLRTLLSHGIITIMTNVCKATTKNKQTQLIRAYVAKRYLKLKATVDVRITTSELVANGNIIGNSQTAKQMKD